VQRLTRVRESAIHVRGPIVRRALTAALRGWRDAVATRRWHDATAKRVERRMQRVKTHAALSLWYGFRV